MVRTRLALLALISLLAGCGRDLPQDIWVSTELDDGETEMVLRGMLGWEHATGLHIFNYRGRIADPAFSYEDFGDEFHVVYKIHDASSEYRYLEHATGSGLSGYGTYGDVLVALDWLDEFWMENPDELVFIDGAEVTRREYYLRIFQEATAHELGHFIGLGHISGSAVMNPDNSVGYPTSLDLEVFWSVYHFRYRRPR